MTGPQPAALSAELQRRGLPVVKVVRDPHGPHGGGLTVVFEPPDEMRFAIRLGGDEASAHEFERLYRESLASEADE